MTGKSWHSRLAALASLSGEQALEPDSHRRAGRAVGAHRAHRGGDLARAALRQVSTGAISTSLAAAT
jgi:hypothetical protein